MEAFEIRLLKAQALRRLNYILSPVVLILCLVLITLLRLTGIIDISF